MARLIVDGDTLVVRLSRLERLGALTRRDPAAPVASIRLVRVSRDPWRELRGVRAPGTGIPRVIALGVWRGSGVRDFVAVYRHQPAVIVELQGARYGRFVVSCEDADSVAVAITGAAPG